jgi:hypothetical protein
MKIANETCMRRKWQGEERSPHHDIEIESQLRGTSLGGRAHRHPLTRITGDQAKSGIGQPQGRGMYDE